MQTGTGFRILILPVTWKTQNRPRGRILCVFETHTFVPTSWMCKKQTSVSHSSTESEIVSLDARFTHGRNSRAWSLGLSDWSISFVTKPNKQIQRDGAGKPATQQTIKNTHQFPNKDSKFSTMILCYPMSILFLQKWILLNLVRCCTLLKIMKRWSRWSSRAEVIRWDTALDWLFDRINLDPKIQIKYADTKIQLADVLTKGSFTRDGWNRLWQSRSRRWFWFRRLKQVLRLCWVQMHPTVRWYSEHPVSKVWISKQVLGETSRLVFKSKWRSIKFSSVANRCTDERTCEETRCCRHEPGSVFSRTCTETCRWKLRYQRRRRLEVAAQSPQISCLRSTSRESPLESATATQAQARWKNEGPRCEYADMGNVHDGHPTSGSSSWNR